MLQRLQQKWKVNGLQLVLILCTFAIGGSMTGFAGKKIMNFFFIDQRWIWLVTYIIIVTAVWPFSVLLVSIPFGQYRFFTKYLQKMGNRMGLRSYKSKVGQQATGIKNVAIDNLSKSSGTTDNSFTTHQSPITHVAIFASGAGSNAQKIIDHFRDSALIKIALIVCNKPGAGVLSIAVKENIPAIITDKEKFFRGSAYTQDLKEKKIDFIILAGFLWKIPDELIKEFPGKIINIHPALLPKYGGKGMYGNNVHEAVIGAGEKESGITIHYVDGHYDNGDIIFQARCAVLENDTAASLASRIHQLEHEHYPKVIEKILTQSSRNKIGGLI
ncbi:MAG: phosphoribosylglycinamide formyltransferase [Chitinophagaceae bacterium]